MALPTDSGESFIREVDENLKRDQARDFARKNLAWIIAAFVLFLAAVGGFLYWQHWQQQKAAEQSEQLAEIYRALGTPAEKNVPARLQALSKGSTDGVRATALFAKAALATDNNDRPAAIADYAAIAGDAGLPQAYRDLATVRRTALEFDSLKPEEIISRLQPMTKAGEPFFGTAGELTAMALLKQGKKTEAGRMFAAIAADEQAPGSIRARAVQIAGSLGVDASASVPKLITQQSATQGQ